MKILLLAFLFLGCGSEQIQEKKVLPEPETIKTVVLPSNVVVITYHGIASPADRTSIRLPSDFVSDLNYLQAQGWAFTTLETLYKKIQNNESVEPSFILNFDDGLTEHFSIAATELSARGLSGNFFISTGLVDKYRYVTWEEVQQMDLMGMKINSHSFHHDDLEKKHSTESDQDYQKRIEFEMLQSKVDLETHGIFTDVMALPYGSGIREPVVLSAAQKAGYSILRGVGMNIPTLIPGMVVKNLRYFSVRNTTDIASELPLVMNLPLEVE